MSKLSHLTDEEKKIRKKKQRNETTKKWRNNPDVKEKLAKYRLEWNKNNSDKIKIYSKNSNIKYYQKNKKAHNSYSRNWAKNNKDRIKEISLNSKKKAINELSDSYLLLLFKRRFSKLNLEHFEKIKDILKLQLQIEREIKLQKQL